jgi:hypothetical protein
MASQNPTDYFYLFVSLVLNMWATILDLSLEIVVGKIIVGVFFPVNYFGPRVYLEESSFITFL